MIATLKKIDNKKSRDLFLVTDIIRKFGPVTKQQIISRAGYKHATMARIIDWLEDNRIICQYNTDVSTGGRKPILYKINPEAGYIIGIDIARIYTKVALLDLNFNVLQLSVFGMFEDSTWDIVLNKIVSIIQDLSTNIQKEKLLGVGVGVFGPIDKTTGALIDPVHFLSAGWENVNIKKSLEERTGIKTVIENGVNAAVLAEYNSLYYKNYNSVAYINAGMGLRLGYITRHGPLYNSYSNEEGFGHMIVDMGGETCYCGNKGCVETYASIPAVINSLKTDIKNGKYSSVMDKINYDLASINFEMFCEAVEDKDSLAVEIITKSADYFSTALVNTVNIINPEVVILGGPLIMKCNKFYELSVSLAKQKLNKSLASKVIFSLGKLGENAVNIGAANIALDNILNSGL